MASTKNSIMGIILNPVGYVFQHTSIHKEADKYAAAHPPGAGLNPATETEVSFAQNRQGWIDGCAGTLRSIDAGYSKAECQTNCAGKFDGDPGVISVRNSLQQHAIVEKQQIQAQTESNNKKAILLIIGILLAGLLLYLFLSK